MNFEDYVNEALKVKYVIRKGKKIKKFKSTKDNYRIQYKDGKPKEVRIKASEKRKRKLGQKKGKIKRKAKEGVIEMRRKKSFIARKSMGLKYNKQIPDKHAESSTSSSTKLFHSVDKPLAPKFKKFGESFQNYIENKSLLLEWPENILYSTDDYDVGWDWCSEVTPEDGGWLWQLVKLYKYNHLDSLRNDRNNFEKMNGFYSNDHIEVSDKDLNEITKNLSTDYFFLHQAHIDLEFADETLMMELKKWLPEELYSAIIHSK